MIDRGPDELREAAIAIETANDLEDIIWYYARSQGVSRKSAEYVVQHAVAQISMDIDHMLRKESNEQQN